jgi:hypothetical protein
MTILHFFASWPVAAASVTAIKVKKTAALGIRIFVESGLEEERLIVKTTVRFFDHLVCPFI